jgi:crossover junction endodeoxyribonuclease RusA
VTGTGALQFRRLDDGAVLIRFAQPAEQLNANHRKHWARKADTTRAWRTAASWAARALKVTPMGPCTVTVQLDVRGGGRRDPHNWYPTVKAIVDGLVDAGVWPDDTPQWVATTEPELRPVKTQPWMAIYADVILTPRHDDDRAQLLQQLHDLRNDLHKTRMVLDELAAAAEVAIDTDPAFCGGIETADALRRLAHAFDLVAQYRLTKEPTDG